MTLEELGRGLARACLTFGYMDEPAMPRALILLRVAWRAEPMTTPYSLDRQIPVPAARPTMPRWQGALFAAMVRLFASATWYFRLPPGRVLKLGSQVEI